MNYEKLAKAVERLAQWNSLKLQLRMEVQLDGLIGNLANGLKDFLGYKGTTSIGDEGVARSSYQSTYKDANWPNDVGKQEECARIFLGCAVTAYYCISYLYWRCSASQKGDWEHQTLGGSTDALNLFMSTVGFKINELQSIKGSELVKRMTHEIHGFSELEKPAGTSSSYETFFPRLESNTAGKPFTVPSPKAEQVTQAIQNLKRNFEALSKKPETSTDQAFVPNPYDDLKTPIKNLLSQVSKFKPENAAVGQGVHHGVNQVGKEVQKTESGQPSPAGPVAATLTTLVLGGGAAAVYLFDLGGAKTLVNGLLKLG
ncbi:variant erythrocyte surface antigen-1 family protein [Babesia caballi]|uniref:Variant erythrocyte surface antigen-1 family protein n=1 Tax=Babesia caballi TaxID=5871 RepID=A0AAV4LUS5_BABCB|nr:variant erythrocyte surface antigen-1 family protein [Babesia caballi]